MITKEFWEAILKKNFFTHRIVLRRIEVSITLIIQIV